MSTDGPVPVGPVPKTTTVIFPEFRRSLGREIGVILWRAYMVFAVALPLVLYLGQGPLRLTEGYWKACLAAFVVYVFLTVAFAWPSVRLRVELYFAIDRAGLKGVRLDRTGVFIPLSLLEESLAQAAIELGHESLFVAWVEIQRWHFANADESRDFLMAGLNFASWGMARHFFRYRPYPPTHRLYLAHQRPVRFRRYPTIRLELQMVDELRKYLKPEQILVEDAVLLRELRNV